MIINCIQLCWCFIGNLKFPKKKDVFDVNKLVLHHAFLLSLKNYVIHVLIQSTTKELCYYKSVRSYNRVKNFQTSRAMFGIFFFIISLLQGAIQFHVYSDVSQICKHLFRVPYNYVESHNVSNMQNILKTTFGIT